MNTIMSSPSFILDFILDFRPQSQWTTLGVLSGLLIVWSYASRRGESSRPPLPPGPKPLPIIGNLMQIPRSYPWRVYGEWAKQYGDAIYLEALGQRVLVLNSLESVNTLFTKRAANYSDRGSSPVMTLLRLGNEGWSFAFMDYGQTWRDYRRAFHQELNQTQIHRYHPMIEEEVTLYLRRLLSHPKDFRDTTRYLFGSIIMRLSYGAEDPTYNRQLIDAAETWMHIFAEYSLPGRLLAETFHFLRHVPSWLPGAKWKRDLLRAADLGDEIHEKAYNDIKSRIASGAQTGSHSVAGRLMERLPGESDPNFGYQDKIAKYVAAVSYIAGSDTTVSSAYGVILALGMHPEVQRKAQAELDSKVGTERLPKLADVDQLPYLQAIIKEVGRWHTVGPLSLPHLSRDDDTWNGYHIPARTLVLANTWAILHDPNVFENPMEFNPERYLKNGQIDPSVMDPEAAAFGYGRRICPGRHLSNDGLTLMTASLLHCFDVKPSKDAQGNPVELKLEVESSIVTVPLPFQCDIIPRSAQHEALILSDNSF